jgi:hypothetical protein
MHTYLIFAVLLLNVHAHDSSRDMATWKLLPKNQTRPNYMHSLDDCPGSGAGIVCVVCGSACWLGTACDICHGSCKNCGVASICCATGTYAYCDCLSDDGTAHCVCKSKPTPPVNQEIPGRLPPHLPYSYLQKSSQDCAGASCTNSTVNCSVCCQPGQSANCNNGCYCR